MAAGRKGDVEGARYVVEAVDHMSAILRQMLEEASRIKDSTGIEPTITNSDLEDLLQNIESQVQDDPRRANQFSIIETAVRDIFNELLASFSIDDPSFVQLWNLLDIVSILADTERCDPPLVFHLIEELLDSQTVAGCRKIFDYLESRRERITAKHFHLKNLIILRSCNELLRRLSRAEDTAFCGRVFIFMFQSFPLGDKSSVNLRGEYHVENTTVFDEVPSQKEGPDAMQVDSEEPAASQDEKKTTPVAVGTPKPIDDIKLVKGSPLIKGVSFDAKASDKPKDPDTLYPIFWSLQHSFNQPKRLFDPEYLASFKSGLEDTMVMFKSIPNARSSTASKTQTDKQNNAEPRGTKHKRSSSSDDLASTFNPKYLTSRDLFELEISDMSFRRHILVQALIILDFLLSLSLKAKEKLATITTQNKSVMYSEQTISEEDAKWALDMKRRISEYFKVGTEGPFFLRMVDTVLSRDKNWVRWKMESCPSIQKPAVGPEEVVAAKAGAHKATANRPIRPKPLGSLDLNFLKPANGGLDRLKNPKLYKLPTLASFEKSIADDDFQIEMSNDAEEKERYTNAKASKTWRALRIASKTKLSLFDKIEDSSNIKKMFEKETTPVAEVEDTMEADNSKDTVVVEEQIVVEEREGGDAKNETVVEVEVVAEAMDVDVDADVPEPELEEKVLPPTTEGVKIEAEAEGEAKAELAVENEL